MQASNKHRILSLVMLGALLAASGWASAERPDWAGQGGGRHGERSEREHGRDHDRDRRDSQQRGQNYSAQQAPHMQVRVGGYFDERRRMEAHNYYREQYRGGHCPPGLAKKNNGCLPPGQARQWQMGQPLPQGVQYYPVEPAVQVRLGTPPAGHQFVRVASDILMIAVGTGMVMDAIQDLGR